MLNKLIHKYRPTTGLLHMRADYDLILIPPILFHGTNSNYLKENTGEGVYSPSKKSGMIYSVANVFSAIDKAKDDARFYPQKKPSIPKLLIIDTYKSLDNIVRKHPHNNKTIPNTPQMVLFKQLRTSDFREYDLKVPEGRDWWDNEIILGMNKENIETAIQELLGLKEMVSMESIYPQNREEMFDGHHSPGPGSG